MVSFTTQHLWSALSPEQSVVTLLPQTHICICSSPQCVHVYTRRSAGSPIRIAPNTSEIVHYLFVDMRSEHPRRTNTNSTQQLDADSADSANRFGRVMRCVINGISGHRLSVRRNGTVALCACPKKMWRFAWGMRQYRYINDIFRKNTSDFPTRFSRLLFTFDS